MGKKVFDDDDGRTIADMSRVERRPAGGMFGSLKRSRKDPYEGSVSYAETSEDKKTRKAYILGALGTGLLIALVYIAAFAAVIIIMLLIMGVF